jgi:hypothetical protein
VETTQVVLTIIGAVLGSSVISSAITAGVSWRLGVRGDERAARSDEATARRDTIADRDGLVDQLQEEVTGLRTEVAGLRALVQTQAADLELERAWNRSLVDQIYRGDPPPPRTRPTTL